MSPVHTYLCHDGLPPSRRTYLAFEEFMLRHYTMMPVCEKERLVSKYVLMQNMFPHFASSKISSHSGTRTCLNMFLFEKMKYRLAVQISDLWGEEKVGSQRFTWKSAVIHLFIVSPCRTDTSKAYCPTVSYESYAGVE